MQPVVLSDVSSQVTVGFIAIVASVAAFCVLAVHTAAVRREGGKARARTLASVTGIVILGWLTLTGALAVQGFFAQTQWTPPRAAFGLLPPLVAIAVLLSSARARALLLALPAAWVIGFQVFRVGVEAVLLELGRASIVPMSMTFEGRNLDILTGLSALPVAYFCCIRRSWPIKVAVAWNILGLGLLVNVVLIALRSAAGSPFLQSGEIANRATTLFPFGWLPYFLVPMAFLGHGISLLQLRAATLIKEEPDGAAA